MQYNQNNAFTSAREFGIEKKKKGNYKDTTSTKKRYRTRLITHHHVNRCHNIDRNERTQNSCLVSNLISSGLTTHISTSFTVYTSTYIKGRGIICINRNTRSFKQ